MTNNTPQWKERQKNKTFVLLMLSLLLVIVSEPFEGTKLMPIFGFSGIALAASAFFIRLKLEK